MKRTKEPPLGPRPRFVLEWNRIKELQEAIRRTINANWPLDSELVMEYNELTERLDVECDEPLEHLLTMDRVKKVVL
jgi:hypothetical protein